MVFNGLQRPTGMLVRAAFAVALVCAAIRLATHQLYASALILLLFALMPGTSLVEHARGGDRRAIRLLGGLRAGADEDPDPEWRRLADLLRDERREARARESRLQALVDGLPSAMFVMTPNGRFELVNAAARQLAGEPVSRLEDIAALGPAVDTLTSLPAQGRAIVHLENGQAMLARSSSIVVPTRGQHRLLVLHPLAGELDSVSVKAWQDVTRVLAHEMMNSLTPVLSLTQGLVDILSRPEHERPAGITAAEITAALGAIGERAEHLMGFVERYRRVATVPTPVPHEIDLPAFVKRIDQLVSAGMATRGISYSSEVLPNVCWTFDAVLIEQAILNLVENARDAAGGGDNPMVALRCRGDNAQMAFEVTDNGPGMSLGQREAALLPFFTTKPSGSGIGLTIAHQIALTHGGALVFGNGDTSNGGLSVSLTLPRLKVVESTSS